MICQFQINTDIVYTELSLDDTFKILFQQMMNHTK